jgi:hypothetical protein
MYISKINRSFLKQFVKICVFFRTFARFLTGRNGLLRAFALAMTQWGRGVAVG